MSKQELLQPLGIDRAGLAQRPAVAFLNEIVGLVRKQGRGNLVYIVQKLYQLARG